MSSMHLIDRVLVDAGPAGHDAPHRAPDAAMNCAAVMLRANSGASEKMRRRSRS
jgi:hypothetical protein